MNIELKMLQVLDDPTGVRMIVRTSYPDFGNTFEGGTYAEKAYFMIDRSDANFPDEGGPKVYDYWQVSDSLGQSHVFNSNVELIEFLKSIGGITESVWVESF